MLMAHEICFAVITTHRSEDSDGAAVHPSRSAKQTMVPMVPMAMIVSAALLEFFPLELGEWWCFIVQPHQSASGLGASPAIIRRRGLESMARSPRSKRSGKLQHPSRQIHTSHFFILHPSAGLLPSILLPNYMYSGLAYQGGFIVS